MRNTVRVWRQAQEFVVTPELLRRYQDIVGPSPRRGLPLSPDVPLFVVVPAWPAVASVLRELVEGQPVTGVLQTSQDVHLARCLSPADKLRARSRIIALHRASFGALATVETAVNDSADNEVATLSTTVALYGFSPLEQWDARAARPRPRRAGPPVKVLDQRVGADVARRYAAVSGDTNPVHLDADAAKALGYPGAVVHGACILAIVVAGAVHALGDDMAWPRRVSCTFNDVVLPGDVVRTILWRAETGASRAAYVFRAETAQGVAIRQGFFELDRPS